MDIIINLAIVSEMLFVNLLVVNLCSHKKYSNVKTYGALSVFTVALFTMAYGLLSQTSNFGNGNGMFALFGFLYLVPLCLLYQEKIQQILSILCSSWIYTMLIFCVAVHLAKQFSLFNFFIILLILQTILYLITAYPFVRWIRTRFLFLLENISHRMHSFLLMNSLCWFGTVIIVNLSFIYTAAIPLKIIALFVLGGSATMSYLLMVELVSSTQNEQKLKKIVFFDHLTGLRNRAGLFFDAEVLISNAVNFTIIYMDLNRFKSVNDCYGHQVGDEYLCFFAKEVRSFLSEGNTLYRMSGDEFVAIIIGNDTEYFVQALKCMPSKLPEHDIAFEGCSLGCANFPADANTLDKLILYADKCMYDDKRRYQEAIKTT